MTSQVCKIPKDGDESEPTWNQEELRFLAFEGLFLACPWNSKRYRLSSSK